MARIILTIGPQYAGKSTFCEKIVALDPSIQFVSRDRILIDLFGTVWLDPYTGGHHAAYEKMWRLIRTLLKNNPDCLLLLDCWNGPNEDRKRIIEKLRRYGVTDVLGWYFVTPKKQCIEWSLLRDPPKDSDAERGRKQRAIHYGYIYDNYHSQEVRGERGFASIMSVNPLTDSPEAVLKLTI